MRLPQTQFIGIALSRRTAMPSKPTNACDTAERGGLTFIETVRSVGYRFHASP
jgi:hypothetical protein